MLETALLLKSINALATLIVCYFGFMCYFSFYLISYNVNMNIMQIHIQAASFFIFSLLKWGYRLFIISCLNMILSYLWLHWHFMMPYVSDLLAYIHIDATIFVAATNHISENVFSVGNSFFLTYILFFYKPHHNLRLTDAVFCTFKNVWKPSGSNQNPKRNFLQIYLKFFMWALFSIGYFFFYTLTGLFIYGACLAVTVFYSLEPFGLIVWVDICRFIFGFAFACAIDLYLMVQISYLRNLLIDVIGYDVFNTYLGSNPGSEWLKLITKATASVFVASTASAMSLQWWHKELDQHYKNESIALYERTMEKNNLPVNPEHVKDIIIKQEKVILPYTLKKQ